MRKNGINTSLWLWTEICAKNRQIAEKTDATNRNKFFDRYYMPDPLFALLSLNKVPYLLFIRSNLKRSRWESLQWRWRKSCSYPEASQAFNHFWWPCSKEFFSHFSLCSSWFITEFASIPQATASGHIFLLWYTHSSCWFGLHFSSVDPQILRQMPMQLRWQNHHLRRSSPLVRTFHSSIYFVDS